MAKNTKISWTNHSWNPVTGCSKVSKGCDNCYAETISERYRGTPAYPNGFDITLRPHKLNDPVGWKSSMIFVNSMSDLFHKNIPDDYLISIWNTMIRANHHTYQVLTKRPHRMLHKINELELSLEPHIWLGTSIESQKFVDNRLSPLTEIPCAVHFISAEPLLGPLDLTNWIDKLDWVIVGGESGNGRRAMNYDWARSIRDQCLTASTAFFYKQGNDRKSGMDNVLDGRKWEMYPE